MGRISIDMRADKVSHSDLSQTNWRIVFLVCLGVAVSLLPLLFQLSAPSNPRMGAIFAYLLAVIAAVLCYALDRTPTKKEKADALFLCVGLVLTTTYLHVWLVDLNSYFQGHANLEWQIYMQNSVLGLSRETLPHSYRFLPNSLVRLFEQFSGDFASARDGYRNLFGVLFFYSFYRFARLFLRHGGSLLCLALLAVIFPVSFRFYAGQLTDPLAHLSFVLAFIFIYRRQFVYLLLTIAIGCLVKESIMAMAGYYILFRWREDSYILKSALLVVVSLTVYEIARVSVLHGFQSYQQISGVGFEHVAENWNDYSNWLPGLIFMVGIFVPFVIAGWQKSPWTLRALAIYWFPTLFFSSLFFSWLREARNFVPLSALLAVMAVLQLLPAERLEQSSDTTSRPDHRGSRKVRAR